MEPKNQVSVLNDLITKSYDAEIGYKEVSEKVKTPQLKNIFNEFTTQRNKFGHQIKEEIHKLGGEVEKGDSVAAKAHRTWIDIKTAFSTNEDKAVLEEVIRGESYAIDAYKEALDKLPINTPAYDCLVKQRNSIRSAKERMENLDSIFETKS